MFNTQLGKLAFIPLLNTKKLIFEILFFILVLLIKRTNKTMFGSYIQGHHIDARLWIEYAISDELYANANGT